MKTYSENTGILYYIINLPSKSIFVLRSQNDPVLQHFISQLMICFQDNGPSPLFRLFSSFKKQFLRQINVKNDHPVYGAGFRTPLFNPVLLCIISVMKPS